MALELRGYQAQCVQRAVASNTIVCLPTGKGKTLIAARVVDHFLRADAGKHAVFMVPTKALVDQQAGYCEKHCECKLKVAKLCGKEMDGWDEVRWKSCLEKHRVLVGTPAVFGHAMDRGFLSAAQFSLVVFDECHNAKGNSPMAAIMQDHVGKLSEVQRPRILGLTASFYPSTLKRKRDAEVARVELELLLKSQLFCPDVQEGGAAAAAAGTGTSPAEDKWHRVDWEEEHYADAFESKVKGPLKGEFAKLGDVANVKELNKVPSRMEHVFRQLGKAGLIFYVRACIVRQLQRQHEDLEHLRDLPQAAREHAQALLDKLPQLKKLLEAFATALPQMTFINEAPELSRKVLKLHQLLQVDQLAEGKGIVFVEQVALTFPLAESINQHVKRRSQAVYGQLPKQDIDSAIKSFRGGETRVLVATRTLEEGIHVDDCDWVVRFDKFSTTKSHIQGSGRARSKASHIYYFDNDPGEEQSKALVISDVARNEALSLTEEQRQDLEAARRPQLGPIEGVYPFGEEGGGQAIHLFNCLEIVYQWCQQVLGASFKADSICESRGGRLAVTVPTREGMETITGDQVDAHWGEITLASVIHKERLQALSKQEQERRRALFVVAVKLRQRGLLDHRNIAATKELILAKEKCKGREPAPLRLSVTGSFGRAAPQVRAGNFKAALQEMLQQRYPSLAMKEVLSYEGRMTDDGGWTSTVRILPTERSFASGASGRFPSKKAAEQDVAKQAYEALTSELLQP